MKISLLVLGDGTQKVVRNNFVPFGGRRICVQDTMVIIHETPGFYVQKKNGAVFPWKDAILREVETL